MTNFMLWRLVIYRTETLFLFLERNDECYLCGCFKKNYPIFLSTSLYRRNLLKKYTNIEIGSRSRILKNDDYYFDIKKFLLLPYMDTRKSYCQINSNRWSLFLLGSICKDMKSFKMGDTRIIVIVPVKLVTTFRQRVCVWWIGTYPPNFGGPSVQI